MTKSYLLLTLTAAIWGTSWMAGSMLSRQGVAPVYSSLGRFAFGAVGLLVIMMGLRPWPKPDRRVTIRLLAMGFLGVLMYNICFFNGLKTVPSGRASLMASLQPSLIFLYSRIVWGERVTLTKLAGLVLSLCGAALVLTQGDVGRIAGQGLGEGDLWILGAVVAWFAYTILGRDLVNRIEPLPATAYSIWAGLVMLGVYLAVAHPEPEGVGTMSFWLITGYIGLFGTTLAFLFYQRGLSEIGASRTSIFINLVPVFSVLSSNLVLHEAITVETVTGGLMALGGVRLLTKQ